MMALVELEQYYPSVKTTEGYDLTDFEVVAQGDNVVGMVDDILVDDQSKRLRYLVVKTGPWLLGKKVLLPIGLAEIVYVDRRAYVHTLTQEQLKELPEYQGPQAADSKADANYQKQILQSLQAFARQSGGQPGNPAAYDAEIGEVDLYSLKDQRLKALQGQLSQQ